MAEAKKAAIATERAAQQQLKAAKRAERIAAAQAAADQKKAEKALRSQEQETRKLEKEQRLKEKEMKKQEKARLTLQESEEKERIEAAKDVLPGFVDLRRFSAKSTRERAAAAMATSDAGNATDETATEQPGHAATEVAPLGTDVD